MGWQDAPVVNSPKWASAPEVKQRDLAKENPSEYDPQSAEYKAKYGAEPVGGLPYMAGRLARAGAQGIAALPLAVMDAGVGARRLVEQAFTGQDPGYQSPSSMWQQGLDSLIPAPQTFPELATEVGGAAVIGGRIPAPKVGNTPEQFGQVGRTMSTFERGRSEGYVAPPTHVNPTTGTRVAEGVAGKLTTQQMASAKNQSVTNRLAARALGLNDDTPLTRESLSAIRSEASEAYRVIRSAGTISTDKTFADDVAAIGSKYRGASKDFPNLASSKEIDDLVGDLGKQSFDADSAVDLIKILRDKADKAYRAGDKGLGAAYRDATRAIEGVIERNLQARGKPAREVLDAFRNSRKLIAKTYTVEKAIDDAGNVDARKIGGMLGKKPLEGDLQLIGEFSNTFPKATRVFNESLPGVSPLDFYASGGVSAATGDPRGLLLPFVRMGVRRGLLSDLVQDNLARVRGPVDPSAAPMTMAEMNALLSLRQQ